VNRENPRLAIQPLAPGDWPEVRAIYLDGIATEMATFETTAPPWEKWDADHLPGARLVARDGSAILGWAALSPVSGRCVYAGVAEVSVYVASRARRQGVGRALLEELVRVSEKTGLWMLQAGIFPENLSSLTLHLRCGFREVGRRERLGKLKDVWRDVILLERRSLKVGVA
jgi:L-amino acid N-acyltransferase YncA